MTPAKSAKSRRIRKSLLLYFKESRWSFLVVIIWFVIGFCYFLITEYQEGIINILLYTFYINQPSAEQNPAIILYQFLGTVVVSQGIFAFIIQKGFEKRDTKITSRMIAKDITQNHIVIIHHGHIGSRIADFFRQNDQKFILIENDRELVEDSLEAGEPVLVGNPISERILKDASIDRARAVIITENDAQITLILMNRIRKLNSTCPIYARMFDDRLGEILEQPPYNAISFSNSRSTIDRMKSDWVDSVQGKAVVVGITNITKRLVEALVAAKREVVVIDEEQDAIDYYKGTNIKAIEGDATQIEFLENPEIDLQNASQVFIGINKAVEDSITIAIKIKRKYPNIRVKMRLFNDDLADFMEQLGIKTFSTSRHTFEILRPKLELLLKKKRGYL